MGQAQWVRKNKVERYPWLGIAEGEEVLGRTWGQGVMLLLGALGICMPGLYP